MRIFAFLGPLFFCAVATLHAGSATWNLDPASSDWNTAANWTPNTVPNGPSDTATFDVSNTTTISVANGVLEVAAIIFNSGASAFTIADDSRAATQLTVSGAGIVNNSPTLQTFDFEKGAV